MMRAVLVNAVTQPPTFGSFPIPTAGPTEVLVKVKASSVSGIVRLSATGALSAPGSPLPFIPGVDGVGHLVDQPSSRVYFAFPTSLRGALADIVAIPRSNVIPLPDGMSDVEAAALANPAVANWMALTRRTKLKKGETVLINGATGIAGRLAVQIAKHLGAGRIIATGRNLQRLEEAKALGADEVIALDGTKEEMVGRFKAVIRSVDVIVDYLWGPSAEQLITACINAGSRTEPARRIRFVNLGSTSGQAASIPAVAFRTNNLELVGSGLGSEPDSELIAAIGEAFSVVQGAGFRVETWTAPIEEVGTAWTAPENGKRLVITL